MGRVELNTRTKNQLDMMATGKWLMASIPHFEDIAPRAHRTGLATRLVKVAGRGMWWDDRRREKRVSVATLNMLVREGLIRVAYCTGGITYYEPAGGGADE